MQLVDPPVALDLEALHRLLSMAGQFLPEIAQEEWSAADHGIELPWRFQQSETNFGSQPHSKTELWRRLIAANAERARKLRECDRTRVTLQNT